MTTEDLLRLEEARGILNTLRHWLHQTQELQLLRSTHPLSSQQVATALRGSPITSIPGLLGQIQAPERLDHLEREYQRIVAEQRVIQDASGCRQAPAVVDSPGLAARSPDDEDFKNPIDAPPVLSNIDSVPVPFIQ